MDYLNNITDNTLRQIKLEIALMNESYSLQPKGHLRDDIFNLLEKVGTLIFYPFKEEKLCGIYVLKNEKHYFIINSAIELEQQIFAAAHELAHSLEIAKVKFEIVTTDLMTEYVNHKEYGKKLEAADFIANRFAAELLVGKNQLIEKFNDLPKNYNYKTKAVLLSDIFLVPFKTIIKRFIEIDLIKDDEIIKELLEIDCKEIKLISERHECRRRNLEISNQEKLGGYIDKAITLYEEELNTFNELKDNLELLGQKPEDFDIDDDDFNINDFLSYAAEDPDLEEDYDEEE